MPLISATVAQAFRLAPEDVVSLRAVDLGPAHLDFVGLVDAGRRGQIVPDAVVMHDGQPFMYLMEPPAGVAGDQALRDAFRWLALRADAPYLAISRPGIVQVYALADAAAERPPVLEASQLQPSMLARLMAGDVPARAGRGDHGAHELMLELLDAVTDRLVHELELAPREALSLVGRALFMRFLGDRGLLALSDPFPGSKTLKTCFATPSAATATCSWLDLTFNGDLLELPDHGSKSYFASLSVRAAGSALSDLTAIMQGDRPVGDGAYQTQLSWGDVHFAYVPVGLLSQVYEAFAHRFDARGAKRQSVYYTPRYLAEYTVDRAFAMLGQDAYKARVLDPASGGGVFLLAAFRRLVRARWQTTGVAPTTSVIRDILNQQLVGLDINPAARQLCALALYLTALELDPGASTLTHLKFKPLEGTVLRAVESIDPDDQEGLGSLSGAGLSAFEDQFDCVLGNPPWTSVKHPARRRALSELVGRSMIERGLAPAANPDGVPDLPFVWAAARWAKPSGVVAFVLHGRLLTKMSKAGHAARSALFQGFDVEYIVNGLELRNTPVWPRMTAPFCLLFARNLPTGKSSQFHAVTPLEDPSLNREGRVRIDSKDAWASDVAMVSRVPWLFKTLAKGNSLDVELLERIERLGFPTLGTALADIPATKGYQTPKKGERVVPADFLATLRDMPAPPEAMWRQVPVANLPLFDGTHVHRRRQYANFRAPLVLLRESPSTRRGRPLAMIALEDVAYRESYIGYSFHGQPHGQRWAGYLSAVFNSPLFLYFLLMTSGKFGVERSALQKSDVDRFPLCPFESLSPADLAKVDALEMALGGEEIDPVASSIVASLYRLRPADHTLIADRLATAMPFNESRKYAMAPPKQRDVDAFQKDLESGLRSFDINPMPLTVQVFDSSQASPWRFVCISRADVDFVTTPALLSAVAAADLMDATRVELEIGGALYVGVLNRRRFWTRTAARTLALDLIKRNHPILAQCTT